MEEVTGTGSTTTAEGTPACGSLRNVEKRRLWQARGHELPKAGSWPGGTVPSCAGRISSPSPSGTGRRSRSPRPTTGWIASAAWGVARPCSWRRISGGSRPPCVPVDPTTRPGPRTSQPTSRSERASCVSHFDRLAEALAAVADGLRHPQRERSRCFGDGRVLTRKQNRGGRVKKRGRRTASGGPKPPANANPPAFARNRPRSFRKPGTGYDAEPIARR